MFLTTSAPVVGWSAARRFFAIIAFAIVLSFCHSLLADQSRELFDCERRAWMAIVREQYVVAEQIARDGLRTIPRDAKPTQEQASLHITLVYVLMFQKRFDESEAASSKAITVAIATDGEKSPIHLRALRQLSQLKDQQKKPNEAEAILKQVLAAEEEQPGVYRRELIDTLTSLADRLRYTERRAEAEPYYLRALELQQSAGYRDQRRISETINQLSRLYIEQKRFRDSEKLLRAFLDSLIKGQQRPGDSLSAETLKELGDLYGLERRWNDAERHYLQGVELLEADLFHDEKILDQIKFELTRLHVRQQKYREADTELRELIKRGTQRKPQDPFHLYLMCKELAELCVVREDFEQAELHYRASIEHRRRVLPGQDSVFWSPQSERLSVVLAINGKTKEAEELFVQFKAACDKDKEQETDEIRKQRAKEVLERLAEADQFAQRRRYLEAEENYRRLLFGFAALHGFESQQVAQIHERLGTVLEAQGRKAEAKIYSDRAANIRRALATTRSASSPTSTRK